jgi:hypothetical protein
LGEAFLGNSARAAEIAEPLSMRMINAITGLILEGEAVMIRISKKSRLNPDEILAKASRYFGKGGEGLDETESGPCCISCSGAGG